MKDIPFFLQTCFGSQIWSHVLENYLRYVGALDFEEEPEYEGLRDILAAEGDLNLLDMKTVLSQLLRASENCDNDMIKMDSFAAFRKRYPSRSDSVGCRPSARKRTRSTGGSIAEENNVDDYLLCDPEALMRLNTRERRVKSAKQVAFENAQAESLLNPTPDMIGIMIKLGLYWPTSTPELSQSLSSESTESVEAENMDVDETFEHQCIWELTK